MTPRKLSLAATTLSLLLCVCSGCGTSGDTLSDDYGKRRGSGLNGLGVLSEMFRQSGSRVITWKRLSPKVQKQDTVIWAPTTFDLPTSEQLEFFEEWLNGDYDRTLILINRDFDAAIGHWKHLLDSGATGEQAIEMRRRLALAEAQLSQQCHQNVKTAAKKGAAAEPARNCEWYSAQFNQDAGWANDFEGDWSTIIDGNKAAIYSGATIKIKDHDEFDVQHLLMENDRPIIARIRSDYWEDGSQVILVANGSTLFNQPLVNHENRTIAANIVDLCADPRRVMVIEGSTERVGVRETDASAPLMLKAFQVWPINFLMIHATLLGILFCICVFPIFGRPREISDASISDFGKHIAAYGDMLQRANATAYVRERIRLYQETKIPQRE